MKRHQHDKYLGKNLVHGIYGRLPPALRMNPYVRVDAEWPNRKLRDCLTKICTVVEGKTMSYQRRNALFELTHGLGQMIAIIESVKQCNNQDSDLQQAVQHLEGDLIRTVGAFHETINDLFEQDDVLTPPSASHHPKTVSKKKQH